MPTLLSYRTLRCTALALAAASVLGACATVTTPTPGDPFEGLNRTIYRFNDKADAYVLKPVAHGYTLVVPQIVRAGVTNVFSNIGDIYIAANDLLQLKITAGVTDVMRVAMNTLFGLGGLFDIASQAGLHKNTADFGLTLAHYGVPSGPYLVLPVLGPSNLRDTAGLVADSVGSPISYLQPASLSWSVASVNLVNTRANLLAVGDLLEAAALDKYSFVRNAYQQRRANLSGSVGDSNAADSGAALPHYDLPDDDAADSSAAPASAATAASAPAATAPAASASAAASAPTAASAGPNLANPVKVPAINFVPPNPNGVHLPTLRLP